MVRVLKVKTWFLSVVGAAGTYLAYLVGGVDTVLTVLLSLMLIDYASGVISAYIRGQLSSQVGLRGIAKKLLIGLMVVLAHMIDLLLLASGIGKTVPIPMLVDGILLRTIVCVALSCNEGISILENCAEAGVWIPAILKKGLAAIRSKTSGEGEETVGEGT